MSMHTPNTGTKTFGSCYMMVTIGYFIGNEVFQFLLKSKCCVVPRLKLLKLVKWIYNISHNKKKPILALPIKIFTEEEIITAGV